MGSYTSSPLKCILYIIYLDFFLLSVPVGPGLPCPLGMVTETLSLIPHTSDQQTMHCQLPVSANKISLESHPFTYTVYSWLRAAKGELSRDRDHMACKFKYLPSGPLEKKFSVLCLTQRVSAVCLGKPIPEGSHWLLSTITVPASQPGGPLLRPRES